MKNFLILLLNTFISGSLFAVTGYDTTKVALQSMPDYGLELDKAGFYPFSTIQDNAVSEFYVDSEHNIFLTGVWKGTFSPEFSPASTTSLTNTRLTDASPYFDTFLARYNADFELVWYKHISSRKTVSSLCPSANLEHFKVDEVNRKIYLLLNFDGTPPDGNDDYVKIGDYNLKLRVSNEYAHLFCKFDFDGSLEWVYDLPKKSRYDLKRKFEIDSKGHLIFYYNVFNEPQFNLDFKDTTNTESLYSFENEERRIPRLFVARYDEDANFLSGFMIKADGNCLCAGLGIDSEDNIWITGNCPITDNPDFSEINVHPEHAGSGKIELSGSRSFIAKYGTDVNNDFQLLFARNLRYTAPPINIAGNSENTILHGLEEADPNALFMYPAGMSSPKRLFGLSEPDNIGWLSSFNLTLADNNELYVVHKTGGTGFTSLPKSGDECIPEDMDYVDVTGTHVPVPGEFFLKTYVFDLTVFSLDKNGKLKWKLSHSDLSGNSYIDSRSSQVTADKRIYVGGQIGREVDLDPDTPSSGYFYATRNQLPVGFMARYVETYRVSMSEEPENGKVTVPQKLVRYGEDCIITVEPDAGYQLERLESMQGNEITQNTDGTFTVSNITQPAKIRAKFGQTTGGNEIESDNPVKIHPNPASDIIKIDSPYPVTEITLTDISGKIIHTGTGKEVNIKHLPKGVYIVNVHTIRGDLNTAVIKH